MNFKRLTRLSAAGILLSTALATVASAAVIQIKITNNQASDATPALWESLKSGEELLRLALAADA